MSQNQRARYTLEYKAETVRFVRSGQSIAAVASPRRAHSPQAVRRMLSPLDPEYGALR